MLVRLLVAVLMLTGPLPVRACTCAGFARAGLPDAQAFNAPARDAVKCGCGHRAEAVAEPGATSDTAPSHDPTLADKAANHSHPERHDRDCPAVSPRPVVSAAPTADVPADPTPAISSWVQSHDGGRIGAAGRLQSTPFTRAVPLYISLLTLRN